MTAEQILEKHLLLMLKRTDQSYVSVDEMKQQPEWQATINAMLEYGEMQALRIHDVVGRSEQLKAFLLWAENEWMETPPERQWEQMFDEYLKSL